MKTFRPPWKRRLSADCICLGQRSFLKKLLLLCFATVLLCQQLFAAWAAHLVISPASLLPAQKGAEGSRLPGKAAELVRGVAVRAEANGRVSIVFKAEAYKGETGKRYYLMVSKKRLGPDALQLRPALRSANRFAFKDGVMERRKTPPEGFVEVRPLQPIEKNGESIIEIVLDRETALRSYVVWDFQAIYEKGAMMMDGGLWLTYDLPAFIEKLDATDKKSGKAGPK